MDKYYVPNISEYHIGFEFESKNSSDEINFDWEHIIVKDTVSVDFGGSDTDYDIHDFNYDIVEGRVRVKYLDREDIESLGWRHVDQAEGFFFKEVIVSEYIKKVCSLRIQFGIDNNPAPFVIISIARVGMADPLKDKKTDSSQVFIGYIKNKSELKTLLTQLGI